MTNKQPKSRIIVRCMSVMTAAALVFAAWPQEADAKRLGSGNRMGKQAPVYNRQATPPAAPNGPTAAPGQTVPGAAANPAAATAAAKAPAAGAAAAAQKPANRWLGPVMGLAAGLGLAALFSHLGLGDELGSLLGMVLLALVAAFVLRKLYTLFKKQQNSGFSQRPAAVVAGQSTADSTSWSDSTSMGDHGSRSHSAQHTTTHFERQGANDVGGNGSNGNIGSSSPRDLLSRLTVGASKQVGEKAAIGQTLQHSLNQPVKQLPSNFNEEQFIVSAKSFFINLQKLNDQGDTEGLRQFCTDELWAFFAQDIAQRFGRANTTEVHSLEAVLVGFERDGDEELATVLYTATISEDAEPAHTVEELWTLSRSAKVGGWVLCGVAQAE